MSEYEKPLDLKVRVEQDENGQTTVSFDREALRNASFTQLMGVLAKPLTGTAEHDDLRAKLEASERAAAAMREALELVKPSWRSVTKETFDACTRALSSDAGKDYVRREDMDAECRRVYESKLKDEYEALAEVQTLQTENKKIKEAMSKLANEWSRFTIYWLRRSYEALSRNGYEEGPSSEETRSELNDVLSNLGHEPAESPVPEPAGFRIMRREDMSPKPENVDTSPGHVEENDGYSRGLREVRLAVYRSLRDAGLGGLGRDSLGNIKVEIEAAGRLADQLRAERDELKKALDAALSDLTESAKRWQTQYNRACDAESDLSAARAERDELKNDLATEKQLHAATHQDWESEVRALKSYLSAARAELHDARSECAAVRGVIETLLRSAHPHPKEHPTMTAAWRVGHDALRDSASIGREYRERVERLAEAARMAIDRMPDDWMFRLEEALKEFEK